MASGHESVTLDDLQSDSAYRIEGVFDVSASRSDVWEVLTDYGGLQGVLSSLSSSSVLTREPNFALVQQVMDGHFLFFSRSVKLLLRIQEDPQRGLQFEDVSRASFPLYKGSWHLEDSEGGVRVRYELNVSRAVFAPAFLERGLFRDNALSLLRELKAEIIRRVQASAKGKQVLLDPKEKI